MLVALLFTAVVKFVTLTDLRYYHVVVVVKYVSLSLSLSRSTFNKAVVVLSDYCACPLTSMCSTCDILITSPRASPSSACFFILYRFCNPNLTPICRQFIELELN